MKLQMIGCSHHDAALEFRERISFTTEQVSQTLSAFRERYPSCEIVLLSTCNRVELYATAGDEVDLDRDAVAEFLADPQHGLIARVYVNRIWQWHFGRGIVESLSELDLEHDYVVHALMSML